MGRFMLRLSADSTEEAAMRRVGPLCDVTGSSLLPQDEQTTGNS